ncbi:MAG: TPM domain-containing protein [Thermoplasmata archaeon]|nr:MAG: TPM domain-containing protein [Thermoplasmata archaeon]
MSKRLFILIIGLLIVVFIWMFSGLRINPIDLFFESSTKKRHIYDEAGILPEYDIKKFEEYTNWIFIESDVDIRFVFVENAGNKTIEEIAIEKVQELGIGGESREERGVLLLYDLKGKKLRVEVGYGLEQYFPDAFVGYLVHDHTRDFFSTGDLTTGLKLLIRMLHHRIREEILGNTFDPRVIKIIRHQGHLSGGAGVSASMPVRGQNKAKWRCGLTEEARQNYSPKTTPKATYEKYLEWLVAGKYDPRIEIFTQQSQKYISSFPMTKAYFHYILMQEYGRKYKISIRNDVALLYFTNDPLVCPHFFVKTDNGWKMDIYAEVKNTRNRVGGLYVWDYRGRNDIYTKAFSDKLINIKNYIRIVDGDNRELPIRGSL